MIALNIFRYFNITYYDGYLNWCLAGAAALIAGAILILVYSLGINKKILIQIGAVVVLVGAVLVAIGNCVLLNKEGDSREYTAETALWVAMDAIAALVLFDSIPDLR